MTGFLLFVFAVSTWLGHGSQQHNQPTTFVDVKIAITGVPSARIDWKGLF